MVKEVNGWPVNAAGQICGGSGDNVIVGYLPESTYPVDADGKMVFSGGSTVVGYSSGLPVDDVTGAVAATGMGSGGVSVVGNNTVGSVLTATPSADFTAASYQWTRDGVDIVGQTASTYTTVLADDGKDVSCKVTGTLVTAPKRIVDIPVAPVLIAAPTVTGTPTAGAASSYVAGSWSGASSVVAKWQLGNDVNGSGAVDVATTATYTPSSGDVGKYLGIFETATNAVGNTFAKSAVWRAVQAALSLMDSNKQDQPLDIAALTLTDFVKNPISVPIPAGNPTNEVTHPSVLYFEAGWNGWKYVMAYTPYPNSLEDTENPCFAVSNDGDTWQLADPSTPLPFQPNSDWVNGYWSDTEIVLDPVDNNIVILFRGNDRATGKEALYYRKTSDGITFTARQGPFMETVSSGGINCISPSLNRIGTEGWELFYHHANGAIFRKYDTTLDGVLNTTTKDTVTLNRPAGTDKWWHSQIRQIGTGDKRVGYFQEAEQGYAVWFGESNDKGLTWSYVLYQGGTGSGLSGAYHYRSSFVMKPDGKMELFASSGTIESNTAIFKNKLDQSGKLELVRARAEFANGVTDENTTLVDTFNRTTTAAASVAGIGTPEKGTYLYETGTLAVTAGNGVRSASADARFMHDTGSADHSLYARINVAASSEQMFFVRALDRYNCIRVGVRAAQNRLLVVQLSGNTTIVPVTDFRFPFGKAANQEIEVRVKGGTLTIFIDGHKAGEVDISGLTQHAARTRVGVHLGDGTMRVDRFMARKI